MMRAEYRVCILDEFCWIAFQFNEDECSILDDKSRHASTIFLGDAAQRGGIITSRSARDD